MAKTCQCKEIGLGLIQHGAMPRSFILDANPCATYRCHAGHILAPTMHLQQVILSQQIRCQLCIEAGRAQLCTNPLGKCRACIANGIFYLPGFFWPWQIHDNRPSVASILVPWCKVLMQVGAMWHWCLRLAIRTKQPGTQNQEDRGLQKVAPTDAEELMHFWTDAGMNEHHGHGQDAGLRPRVPPFPKSTLSDTTPSGHLASRAENKLL
jgi:hypothetical protein